MSKVPYIPLYIGDWEQDTNCLSLQAEAAWLKVVIKMFKDNKSGIYKTSTKALQNLWRCTDFVVQEIIQELKDNNICDFGAVPENDKSIVFRNRRMLKEIEISKVRSIAVQNRYKNHTKANTKPLQNTEYEIENENINTDVFNSRVLEIIEESWKAFFIEKENKQRHLISKKEKEQIQELFTVIISDQKHFTDVPKAVNIYLQANYKPKNMFYDLNTPLPDVTIEAARLKQAAISKDFSDLYIQNQWKAFLAERLNDSAAKKEYYQSIEDLTSYFLNWLPKQKNTYNGTIKHTAKPGSKSAGATNLLNSFLAELNAGSTNP